MLSFEKMEERTHSLSRRERIVKRQLVTFEKKKKSLIKSQDFIFEKY